MSPLATVAWLGMAVAGLHTDVQLKAGSQVRAGYSRTPFTQSPDSTPLGNTPVDAQASWVYNLIITPSGRVKAGLRDLNLQLQYTPRLLFDLNNITTTTPQVFHSVRLDMLAGQPHALLVTAYANLTVGGVDLGAAGGLAGEFVGTLRPGVTTAPASYTNLTGNLKVEHPVGRDWKFASTEIASKLVSPENGGGLTFTLQSQTRFETRNELRLRLGSVHSLIFGLAGSYVQFPFNVYAGYTPSFGWEAVFDTLTLAHARLGVYNYWTSPYRGDWERAAWLVIGELGIDHTFTDLGLPRLSGSLQLTERPYFDLVLGQQTPRATLTARLTYRLSHRLDLQLQVRDFTPYYPNAHLHWQPIPAGEDTNVMMLTLQLKYKVVTWLTLQAGSYGLDRNIVSAGPGSVTSLQEVYFFLGATGTFDIK